MPGDLAQAMLDTVDAGARTPGGLAQAMPDMVVAGTAKPARLKMLTAADLARAKLGEGNAGRGRGQDGAARMPAPTVVVAKTTRGRLRVCRSQAKLDVVKPVGVEPVTAKPVKAKLAKAKSPTAKPAMAFTGRAKPVAAGARQGKAGRGETGGGDAGDGDACETARTPGAANSHGRASCSCP